MGQAAFNQVAEPKDDGTAAAMARPVNSQGGQWFA